MADPEHLAKLNDGVVAWNEWVRENSDVKLDLGKAHLSGANLGLADLTDAMLSGANLTYARNLTLGQIARATGIAPLNYQPTSTCSLHVLFVAN